VTDGGEFDMSTFKVQMNESDKAVNDFVVLFEARLKHGDLQESYWTDKSEYRQISRYLLLTAVSEYWTKRIKFDPLVDPSQFEVKRNAKEKKGAYKKRLQAVLHARIIHNEARLRQLLSEKIVHEHRVEHANALVHSLRSICQKVDLKFLEPTIQSNPKLVPSIGMLKRLGRVPDFTIREYKELFFPSEWRVIQTSELYRTEETMRQEFQRPVEMKDVERLLSLFNEFHTRVSRDRLSSAILQKKKDRLTKASSWKRESAGEVVKPLETARRQFRDESVRSAFSPVDIFVAANEKGAAEIDSSIVYDTENKTYYLREQIAEHSSETVRAICNEIIVWLNSI